MKKHLVYHPFLYSLYPIAALIAENLGQFRLSDVIRSVFFTQAIVLILLLIFKLIVRDWQKAALLCTGLILLFFSYGHVYLVLKAWTISTHVIGRHRYLVPMFFLVWVGWAFFILRRIKNTRTLSILMTLSGFIAFSLPSIAILNYAFQPDQRVTNPQPFGFNDINVDENVDLPNIFYIVLDGYGGGDILDEIYDYDNGDFLNFLRSHGFYVADKSKSNYVSTVLSLSSSMNLDYVGNLIKKMDVDSDNEKPIHELIKASQVVSMLRSIGYRIIAFETGYPPTVIDSADIFWDIERDPAGGTYVDTGGLLINPFEEMLLRSSGAVIILDATFIGERIGFLQFQDPQYALHRQRVIYNVTKLSDVPLLEGNYFVFCHILSPHPPFVFGENGEHITPDRHFALADGSGVYVPEEYISGYRDQLKYLNLLLMEAINDLLDRSDDPPLIILQGDHGPGAFTDWYSFENTNIRERSSILNAYYFPGINETIFYPEITPVNSFRMLFNHYFGTDFEIVADKSYFNIWNRPYDYIELPVD
jgi:hypothetical protein